MYTCRALETIHEINMYIYVCCAIISMNAQNNNNKKRV